MLRERLSLWVKRLRRPRFADREFERLATTVELAALASLVGVFATLLGLATNPHPRYGIEAPLIGLGGIVGCLVLIRRGRLHAASWLFLGTFLGAVVTAFLHVGTLFTPGFGALVLLILLGGLLLGVRGAVVMTAVSMATALGVDRLLTSELWQRVGWSGSYSTDMSWALLLLVMGGLLIVIPINRMQLASREATRSEEALATQNEALRASESRYRVLLENAPLGVLVVDADLKIESVNAELVRLLGAPSSAELVGVELAKRPLYRVPEIRDAVKTTLAHGQRVSLEASGRSAWGRDLDMRIHLAPLLGADGRVRGGQALIEDIGERRKLEEQLRHSQKLEAVGTLAGGIAHDFNNCLTVILQGIESLALDLPADDPRRAAVNEIGRAAEQSAALTRQLLAFGRKQIFQPRTLDPNRLLQDLEGMLRRVLGELIVLETKMAPDVGWVSADSSQIEVALVNLASNARDAMPGGGTLRIETEQHILDPEEAARYQVAPGAYVAISVHDTGSGMDAATREHIFEPFFTNKPEGTGLGLSSVHGIVAQSEGTIQVESAPGRGSTFRILLPRVAEPPEESPAPPDRHPAAGGSETILLVEDGEAVRSAARRGLEGRGYTVLEAADGAQALEVATRHGAKIDLVLTDVIMPGIGGSELASRLRPLHPEMRVLYMSGYVDDAVLQQGALDPAVSILRKPFSLGDLLAHVREVLDPQP